MALSFAALPIFRASAELRACKLASSHALSQPVDCKQRHVVASLYYIGLHFDVLEGPTTLPIKAQDQLVVLDDGFLVCDGEQRDT